MGGGVGWKMMDENLFLGDNMLNINCLNPICGVSKKCSFNVHKDKGVFLNDKMFDKKDFVI